MKRVFVWLLCLSILGCGSEAAQVAGPTGTVREAAAGPFNGLVALEATKPGARIEVYALGETTPRWSGQADGGGYFQVPVLTMPPELRVVATPPGEQPVEMQVDTRVTPTLFLCPNYLTTMVSLYRQRHPELALELAQRRVLAALGMQENQGLNLLGNGPASPFSHREFQLASGGDALALAGTVASQVDEGRTRSFRAPSRYPNVTRMFLPPAGAEAAEQPSFWTTLGQNMLLNPLNIAEQNFFGWVTGLMGWNVGTAGALREIEGELGNITRELNQVQSEVQNLGAAGNLTAVDDTINNAVSAAHNITNSMLTNIAAVAQTLPSPSPNTSPPVNRGPAEVPSQVTNIVNAANQQLISAQMVNLTNFLDGDNAQNTVLTLNNNYLYSINQLQSSGPSNPQGNTLNYETRYDKATESLQNQQDYYRGILVLLANAVAETAHASILPAVLNPSNSSPSSPAKAINEAAARLATAAELLQASQAFVPQPMGSDILFVDVPNGLMWCCTLTDDISLRDALDTAQSFTTSTSHGINYSNWQIPTLEQLQTLSQRLTNFGELTENGDLSNNNAQKFGFSPVNQHGNPASSGWYVWYHENGTEGIFDLLTGKTSFGNLGHEPQAVMVRTITPADQHGDNVLARVTQMGAHSQSTDTFLVQASTGNTSVQAILKNTSISGSFGTFDVTSLCYFTSDRPRVVSVSNLPGQVGQLTWHGQGGVANITGHLFVESNNPFTSEGAFNTTLTATATNVSLTPPAPSNSLLLTPQNVALNLVSTSDALPYFVLGFFSDGTLQDLTSQAIFNASPNTQANFGGTNSNGLLRFLVTTFNPRNLTITATITNGGVVNTTNSLLNLPGPIPAGSPSALGGQSSGG